MSPEYIKELKIKIETYEENLYSMELEVDLIYDACKTLIRMGSREIVIELWFQDMEQELKTIIDTIKEIETKGNL